jgi:VanZ family protein
MAVIFSASADTESARRSSRIIAPLVRWLLPHLSDATVDLIVLVVRKCAHVTEYAILGMLLWRALRMPVKGDPRPWSWREAGGSILVLVLYASTDEFLQLFVPSREASLRDVLIDTAGGVLGLLVLWVFMCWRRRRRNALPT